MSEPTAGRQRFDEAAALEQLEGFRREIERYRLKRKNAEEEFELFTASFKQPASAPVMAAPAGPASPPAHSVPRQTLQPVAVVTPAPEVVSPGTTTERPALDQDQQVVQPAPQMRPARRVAPATYGIAAGAILLVAAGTYFMSKPKPTAPAPAAVKAPTPSAATHPVAPKPAPVPTPSHESVMTTTGPVWVRVIADGVPVVERQLAPNSRLPFTARESIVIRAGDAGAVRLTIEGVDQGALGRTGEVVTRKFDVRARRKEM